MKKEFFPSFCLLIWLSSANVYAGDLLYATDQDSVSLIYLIPILILAVVLFIYSKVIAIPKPYEKAGFLSIIPQKESRFFPIPDDITNMESVVEALADENTNVYSNLSKILLTVKPNGLLVEDKNFKNSILVNRRRSRRYLLQQGSIIDMGELTVMYVDSRPKVVKHTHGNENGLVRNNRMTGKIPKNRSTLIPADPRSKTFYLTKNITYIGRSNTTDLIAKPKSISLRHAKIEKVSGRYKLVDLNSRHGTYVNGRRIEEKFLRNGDEIAFETVKYRFSEPGRSR